MAIIPKFLKLIFTEACNIKIYFPMRYHPVIHVNVFAILPYFGYKMSQSILYVELLHLLISFLARFHKECFGANRITKSTRHEVQAGASKMTNHFTGSDYFLRAIYHFTGLSLQWLNFFEFCFAKLRI